MPRGKTGLRNMQNVFKSIKKLPWVAKRHLPQMRFHDSEFLGQCMPPPYTLDTAGKFDDFLSNFKVNTKLTVNIYQ